MFRAVRRLAKSSELLRLRHRHGRRLGALALLLIAAGVLRWTTLPAHAAVQLEYYRATPTDFSVRLDWATVREFNLEGFKILMKLESEPEIGYRLVGTRIAQGDATVGARYSFEVTEITCGESYCFRLQEVTTDDTPGEIFDLCGYGQGVTPTPSGSEEALAAGGTPTPVVVEAPPGSTPAPTLMPTVIPGSETATPTPLGGQSPLETPGQPVSPLSPLETPTQPLSPLSPLATPIDEGEALSAQLTQIAESMATETPTWTPLPAETPTFQPTETPMPPPTDTLPPDEALVATATDMFVVVTATPTVEAVAVAATFTPLPTATTPANLGLLGALRPTTQNLMVMMLCLIFLSATGLGTLGLVTTIIFLRSQAQRHRYYDELTRRPRF